MKGNSDLQFGSVDLASEVIRVSLIQKRGLADNLQALYDRLRQLDVSVAHSAALALSKPGETRQTRSSGDSDEYKFATSLERELRTAHEVITDIFGYEGIHFQPRIGAG